MNDLVSVILPVRNGEKTINMAIDSILAQTYPYFELIVVDNSDDSTPEIVKSYDDSRVKYFRQKTKGSVNGYNEALDEYVNGKYVTFIHHDDYNYPDKLYEQVRMIEKFSNVDVVYNNDEFVDENMNTIRIREHIDYYNRNDDLLAVMMIGYGVSNLGMHILIKRDFIEKHNLRYSLDTPVACDHAYIFDLIDAGAVFKHVNKHLYKYRIHTDNYSADREIVAKEQLKIYARYGIERMKEVVAKTNYSETEKQIILGKLYYRLGHIDEGHKYFENILESQRNDWAVFYLGTGYYRYQGDFVNAEKWLRKGYELMPYRAEFANNLGCCELKLNRVESAKALFEKAVSLNSDYYDARYNLDKINSGEEFNPRLTDREIEGTEQSAIVYRAAENKREETGSLQPAGQL